jgi:hypothetical protein
LPSYDPSASPEHEFGRLSEYWQWNLESATYKDAREEFNRVFQKEFGSDVLDFFEGYRELGFDHNPQNDHNVELNRLRKEQGWNWVSGEWIDAREAFHSAVRVDFNKTFGEGDDDVEGWQFLCKVLGVKGNPPSSADECQEVCSALYSIFMVVGLMRVVQLVKDIHTNIFDILEYTRRGFPKHQPLRSFETEEELGKYSYSSDPKKVYPREWAKFGALRFVLRGIAAYRELKKPDGQKGKSRRENQPGGKGKKKRKRNKKKKAATQDVEPEEDLVVTSGVATLTLAT